MVTVTFTSASASGFVLSKYMAILCAAPLPVTFPRTVTLLVPRTPTAVTDALLSAGSAKIFKKFPALFIDCPVAGCYTAKFRGQ